MITLARLVLSLAAVFVLAGHPTPAGNKLAAQRDAERLLARVVLPAGSQQLASEPSDDGGVLGGPVRPGSPNLIERFRFWRVPGSFDAVDAFVGTHPPRGSHYAGCAGCDGSPDTFFFAFPPTPGRTSYRQLNVTIAVMPDGSTALGADAQEIWIVPRPPTEVVPRGVSEIDGSVRVTNRGRVARIVRWFNRLPTVQPGTTFCRAQPMPAMSATLDFRSANGHLLAKARFTTFAPDFSLFSTQCNPISFSIHGRRQTSLIGGRFLLRVQRLVGEISLS